MTSTANQHNTNLMMPTGGTRSKSRVNMSGLLHLNAMTSACTESTKEGAATSTAGSTAATSQLSQVGKDTFQLRTRANFGDYQYYVPPETKATPSSVPVPKGLQPVDEVEEEKKDNDDDSELIIPNPMEQRRLQLFEESSQVDQLPFDQVWNQEEFTLDKSSDEGSGINSHSLDHDDDDDDKPFDEPEPEEEGTLPENSLEVSGSSAFTAFSTNSSLPPPPPPLPAAHKRLTSPLRRNKATAHKLDVEFPSSPTSPILSGVSSVDLNAHSKSLECDDNNDDDDKDDDDIPSDEDESKKSIPTSDQGREKRNLSLATASQRTTAEDLGQRTVAENLSNLHDSEDDEAGDDDDKSQDSLFDFKEKRLASGYTTSTKARAPSPSPDQWAGPDPPAQNSEDEEASCEDGSKDGAVPGLKTRSREAFASRRRLKKSSQSFSPTQELSASPQRSSSPPAAKSTTATKHHKNQVSFGATDTIHHFENEYDMNSESAVSYATEDNGKTLGSDVEEAIRDIFMINALESCSDSPRRPSRRKLRYRQRAAREERRDLEPSDDNSDEDEITCQSEDENVAEASSKAKATSRISITDRSKREEAADLSNNEDVFFETMLSMVEGGLGVMSAAFGFAPAAAEEDDEEGEEIPLVCSPPVASPPVALPRQEKKAPPRRYDSYDSGTVGTFEGTIEDDLLESMSDFIMGPEKSASSEVGCHSTCEN